ncbi:hypothetical protein [Vannielia litorea]|uniref:Uncharacterized protein n=1 Tax=Vannielia litorea TaxID=1217970 RepID=A0A1N6IET5_9RHOB|nr:hypothetical protein [Vannielia litorea]SIO30530.1 hypothetical protein SAMN05444002_3785 [Vannielia litorea]
MAAVRIILIVIVLAVMGGIGFMQYGAMSSFNGSADPAGENYASNDTYEPEASRSSASSGYTAGNLIKSTKTTSRVGGDKTITIQRKKPGLWTRIRMWFGYVPEDAHRRDFARLKAQREREAAYSSGINQATGRKESTASVRESSSGASKKAAPNKSVASALSGD